MDAKLLARLRPENETVAGLSEALARISSERLAAEGRTLELRQTRTATLMTGTPKQVAEVEADLRETAILLEQLDLLANEIGPRMDTAYAAAAFARLEAKAAAVRETNARAMAWWRDEYPRLARAIVEGLHLCRAAENQGNALIHEIGQARRNEAVAKLIAGGLDIPAPPRAPVAGVGYVPPSQAVQLPAGPDGMPAFWWPQELRGRATPEWVLRSHGRG